LGNIIYHLGTDFIEKTRDQSHQAVVNIFDRQDKNVWLLKNDIEIETPLEKVLLDDIVVKLKHSIAKAILNAYAVYGIELDEVEESHYEIGFGTTV
jgi:cation transport ATPase